jgi:thiol-disulfide isomerase/thioredoxin
MRCIIHICLVILVSCNINSKPASVANDTEKRLQIDSVQLKDLNTTSMNMDSFKGKVVFLNIWATWCKPCIQEMPSIENAKNVLRDENVVFLLASAETIEEIDTFRKLNTFSFNYVQMQNSEALGIDVLPTTFIFSKKGKLVLSESGYRKWDDKKNIDTILKIINTNE